MGENELDLISVIIPVYNERRYLKACVDSVRNQTYHNVEIILVDDGSNNGASEDCDALATQDRRIKIIHKQNGGLSAARISGLDNAAGGWVMFMDHDDIVSPDILKILFDNVADDIDIVAGRRYDTPHPESFSWDRTNQVKSKIYHGRDLVEMFSDDKKQTMISLPLWGKIYRRSFLDSMDLTEYKSICPTIFFEDVLMTPIIYSKAKNVCIVDKILYIHREVNTSISRSGKLSSFYFEQIQSGDILLTYSRKNELKKYFDFYLSSYIKGILRIFCIMDKYFDTNQLAKYKELIDVKMQKYGREALINRNVSITSRILSLAYLINPRIIVYLSKFYF